MDQIQTRPKRKERVSSKVLSITRSRNAAVEDDDPPFTPTQTHSPSKTQAHRASTKHKSRKRGRQDMQEELQPGAERAKPKVSLRHAVQKVHQYDYLRRLQAYWAHPHDEELRDAWLKHLATLGGMMAGDWQLMILRRSALGDYGATYDEIYTRAEVFKTIFDWAIAARILDQAMRDEPETGYPLHMLSEDVFQLIQGVAASNEQIIYTQYSLTLRSTAREVADFNRHREQLTDTKIGKILVHQKCFGGMERSLNDSEIECEEADGTNSFVSLAHLLEVFYSIEAPPLGVDAAGHELWEVEALHDYRLTNENTTPQALFDFHAQHLDIPQPIEIQRFGAEQADDEPMTEQLEILQRLDVAQALIAKITKQFGAADRVAAMKMTEEQRNQITGMQRLCKKLKKRLTR